ncbi:hypothetical protein LCGC14_0488710 [marine sediment metagenome]|uniref:Uncharacterized protein n=1 Tax=marine sediment metagenome TaxID=412755 RepID=A0A0F9SCI8_9ZZZZ
METVDTDTKTGTNSETILCSMGRWRGEDVWVTHQSNECPIKGHALEIVHHYDDKGRHYCPTMYLMCPYCGGIADESEPYECHQWN